MVKSEVVDGSELGFMKIDRVAWRGIIDGVKGGGGGGREVS